MTGIITITDDDRGLDLGLEVTYSTDPSEPEVGYHGAINVESVLCVTVTTWIGRHSVWSVPDDPRAMGREVMERYRDEIEEQLRRETCHA